MAAPTEPDLTFADLPFGADRDAAWQFLMDRGPMVQLGGALVVVDAELVEQVLRAPKVFSSKAAFDTLGSPLPLVPLAFDPPEHTRFRQLLQPFFSPRRLRELEPSLRAQLGALIDPVAQRGSCDFVAEIATPYPTQAFLTMFGLPLDERDQFIQWKDAILSLVDAGGADMSEEGMTHAMAMFTYLAELVASRRGVPGEDVLSDLLCDDRPDAMTDDEVIGLCFLFVLAGLDTVTDALGFGFERLARDPALQQRIVDDPAVVPDAVEELVRIDPPAPWLPRVTTEEVALGDRVLPPGTYVHAVVGCANRDDTRHADPVAPDFARNDPQHLGFGVGVHRCLGIHLARMEMRLVLEEWHRRIPAYSVTPGTTPAVKWPRGTLGLDALHLTF